VNVVLLTIRFLDVATFTTLTPLSLVISCKLSFPVVGLKMSSIATLALKSSKKVSCGICGIYRIHVPVLRRTFLSAYSSVKVSDVSGEHTACVVRVEE
jgi:hypothetical protein